MLWARVSASLGMGYCSSGDHMSIQQRKALPSVMIVDDEKRRVILPEQQFISVISV